MKQTLTAQRDTVIFDCDGVFYSWNVFGGMDAAIDFCADVKAEVTSLLLPHLRPEDAKLIGRRSYKETGDGLLYFVEIAQERGMDGMEFREQMHSLYHQLQMLRVRERFPGLLSPCAESLEHLAALSGKVQFGVLSQGCRDNWINPLFAEKGITGHFKAANIFGFREFGWNEKSASAKGLGIIMECMEVAPSRVVFVEDTKKNLRPVKETYEEIVTVHLSDWEAPDESDDYIDLSAASNLEFLRTFRKTHMAATPHLQTTHIPLGLHP